MLSILDKYYCAYLHLYGNWLAKSNNQCSYFSVPPSIFYFFFLDSKILKWCFSLLVWYISHIIYFIWQMIKNSSSLILFTFYILWLFARAVEFFSQKLHFSFIIKIFYLIFELSQIYINNNELLIYCISINQYYFLLTELCNISL